MTLGLSASMMTVMVGSLTAPAMAASRISFWYGPFQQSVSTSSLRQYVQTQQASSDVSGLLRFMKPQDREGLVNVLKVSLPIDVVTVSRLLNSPAGDQLLNKLSPMFIRRDQAGVVALRGAIVLASSSKNGLGILSILEAYPAREVNISIPEILSLTKNGGFEGLMGSFLK
ncbi:hypothetical protein DO97_20425 [Neosynechococcus sphagnicola sy1]|uniref:DUF1400 domain-containing protein n=1 Tax=Neosynechococcus sphagnicola sy1 TaxID=1497020 RepID=A0A098TM88_9CYAN|nr:hypothetical protein DO97_20425 [Neosynechococcus sphagnicola sy1]